MLKSWFSNRSIVFCFWWLTLSPFYFLSCGCCRLFLFIKSLIHLKVGVIFYFFGAFATLAPLFLKPNPGFVCLEHHDKWTTESHACKYEKSVPWHPLVVPVLEKSICFFHDTLNLDLDPKLPFWKIVELLWNQELVLSVSLLPMMYSKGEEIIGALFICKRELEEFISRFRS